MRPAVERELKKEETKQRRREGIARRRGKRGEFHRRKRENRGRGTSGCPTKEKETGTISLRECSFDRQGKRGNYETEDEKRESKR